MQITNHVLFIRLIIEDNCLPYPLAVTGSSYLDSVDLLRLNTFINCKSRFSLLFLKRARFCLYFFLIAVFIEGSACFSFY